MSGTLWPFLMGALIGGGGSGGGGGGGDTPSTKQVFFIDYDGTVLHSYSKAEFTALSELPENPTHDGLTSQGWNWTKVQISAQLIAMPDTPVYVGQMYVTDDGKTRIYVNLKDRRSPYLGIGVNGTVVIDWGDGSDTDTVTGSAVATVVNTQHTYSAAGNYMITLTVSSDSTCQLFGTSNTAHILKASTSSSSSSVNRVYTGSITKVEIGDRIRFGNYAFGFCHNLQTITIPSTVTMSGTSYFYYCLNLKHLTLPSGVTNVSGVMCSYCYNIVSISLPPTITTINANAFQYCYALEHVMLPSSVTAIENNAFDKCTSLKSIDIPYGIATVPQYAFQYCYSIRSITLPSTVTEIAQYAFRECLSLESINISSNLTKIGNYAFANCYSVKSISMPSNTYTTWGNYVFNNCTSMESITLPTSLASMGTNTLAGCISLREVTLPSNLTTVGQNALQSCTCLSKLTIPSTVTSIDSNAFNANYGMKEYHILATTPPSMYNSNSFGNMASDCVIYVPRSENQSVLNAYKTANYWSTYASQIQEEPA